MHFIRRRIGLGIANDRYRITQPPAFIAGRTLPLDVRGAYLIDASLTRAQQIEFFATGTGFMGSSLEYLRNIAGQFAVLGIQDEEVSALLRETEAYINSR